MNAGYTEEADAWQQWLLRAVAGSPQQLQIMYGVAGDRDLREWQLDWLSGYEGSSPVRVGNAAAYQTQLDVYGEFADVLEHASLAQLSIPPRRTALRHAFIRHLENIWCPPDHGNWECRGAAQHFVHSKVMAWVAFDRAWRSLDPRRDRSQRSHWKQLAAKIHRDICRHGVDPSRGCFVQAYGSQRVDAALLMLAIVGFLPPSDTRIKATIAEIEKRLTVDGLVMRYEPDSGVNGLPHGEGVFIPCSFWLVDNYVLMGRRADAVKLFERLLRCQNDVGLLSEEYDPHARRMLGNFPQAFSHVAFVNSAMSLFYKSGNRDRSSPWARNPRFAARKRRGKST